MKALGDQCKVVFADSNLFRVPPAQEGYCVECGEGAAPPVFPADISTL
jgi:hypothetical protein